MKATVKWLGEGAAFEGITEDGINRFILAGPAELNGGKVLGPKPIDMLLHCAAACTSVDTVMMLKERGAEIVSYEVQVEAQRGAAAPKPIETMHLKYIIQGKGMTDDMIKDVLDIAFKVESGVVNTYNTDVTWSYELTEA
jgi:putative redox protein